MTRLLCYVVWLDGISGKMDKVCRVDSHRLLSNIDGYVPEGNDCNWANVVERNLRMSFGQ
jgi:hypothetical protein